jgi:hypothetical protein
VTLDPSTVLSKVDGAPQRLVLSPTLPEIVIDGGAAGASVAFASGVALTVPVDNSFLPQSAWATASNPQAVAAASRRAIRMGGPNHVPLTVSWS